MIKKLQEQLNNPSPEFRSLPFWAWNYELKKEELIQQIKDMKQQKMGGFFIHSREGLETPYLSDEWFDCVEASIEQGEHENMQVWIYDEDKWPSGMAGGMVSQSCDDFRATALTLEMKDGKPIFHIEKSSEHEWYNGFPPSDNLNASSVERFIELTHEKYKQRFDGCFCKKICGFFTDEPNVCDFFSRFTKGRPWLPWTNNFETYFEEKRGYSITSYLLDLFVKSETSKKTRHDYYKTLTQLFSESYFKQLSDWCNKNKLLLTGHLIFENDLGYNTRTSGAIMPHYRYIDLPGVDILGEQTEEWLTVKQCTSVANQYGKKRVLTETYGCCGWQLDFEGQKWVGDWQFVMGVNVRCQHLFFYTLKGLRKRDYPPSFNYNTTWWEHSHIIEDYFARFSVLAQFGDVLREILIIHPQSTIWTMAGSDINENLENWDSDMGWTDEHIVKLNKLGNEFNNFVKAVLGIHQDFDLGDELIIEEEVAIRDSSFVVNKASYKYVVIPPVETLFSKTVDLLLEFLDKGGKVIAVLPAATMIDGKTDERINRIYYHENIALVSDYSHAIRFISALPRKISVQSTNFIEEPSVLTMLREDANAQIAILVNNDRQKNHEIIVELSSYGKVTQYDFLTNTYKDIEVEIIDGKIRFVTMLKKADSKAFIVDKSEQPLIKKAELSYRHPHAGDEIYAAFGPCISFERTMPNVLVLDKCTYSAGEDGGLLKKEQQTDLWKAQREIRSLFNMQQIYYNGAPQRYLWANESNPYDGTKVELRFSFFVRDIPQTPVFLVLEQSPYFNVLLNGRLQDMSCEAHFIDRCMHKIKLCNIQAGENEITLQCSYINKMELEDIFIIGDFAVDLERQIITEPQKLRLGDWCLQGYPYYGGGIIYKFQYNHAYEKDTRAVLVLGEHNSVITLISINGKHVETVPWSAVDEIDITDYLNEGENTISIEVNSSPVNIFGPFHRTYDKASRISWQDFRTEGARYTTDYVLHPYGLFSLVCILKKKLGEKK